LRSVQRFPSFHPETGSKKNNGREKQNKEQGGFTKSTESPPNYTKNWFAAHQTVESWADCAHVFAYITLWDDLRILWGYRDFVVYNTEKYISINQTRERHRRN
jgi:hypothetical protein